MSAGLLGMLLGLVAATGTAILLGGGAVCLVAYRLMLRIGRLPEDVRVLR